MRLFLDIDSREFLQSPSFPRALTTLALKRRDTDLIELQFVRDRVVQDLPTGTTIRLGLKPSAVYTAEFLATGTFTKSGTGTATRYLLDLNLNTVALNTAFAAATPEPVTLAAMLEVEWTSGTNISSSLTLPVTIANDVIRGDEGEPASVPVFYTAETSDLKASQAEAQAGASNAAWMTPLRVFQAIASWVSQNLTWSTLAGKPSTFPPSTHGHALGEINNLQSALDAKASTTHSHGQITAAGAIGTAAGRPILTTEGGILVAGQFGTTAGSVCQGNDIRLTNNRTPTPHLHGNINDNGEIGALSGLPIRTGTNGRLEVGRFGTEVGDFSPGPHDHPISKITGLQTALDSKAAKKNGTLEGQVTVGPDGNNEPVIQVNNGGDFVKIVSWGIIDSWGGNGSFISFEEASWYRDGELIFYFGDRDTLAFNDRMLFDLGNPVEDTAAVRVKDTHIPRLINLAINSSTAFVPYQVAAGRNVRLHYIFDLTNNPWNPQIVLPKPAGGIDPRFDTVRFGDVFRVQYQPSAARTMNVARYFWNGGNYEANFTNFSTVTSGAKGFCFDGKNWVTEAEFTGL